MNTKKNLLKHIAVGILILFVFIIAVLSCGCTEKGKAGLNETGNTTSNATNTEEIEVKCGIVNALCCENNTCNSNLSCIENKCMSFKINVSTDKELYKSGTTANITTTIESSGDLNNAVIKLYGIKAKGKYKLNKAANLNLTPGKNLKSGILTLPRCNKCVGINPGTYSIYADLVYNGTVISKSSKNIELRQ